MRPLFDSIDLTSDYGPRVERDKDYSLDEYEWGYLPRHLVVVGNIVRGSDIISDGVSCHDIAAIWVAFFSRWQRYRC